MALYAISDLHLSLNADKSMDIFPGWENYRQRLERGWRETVRDCDTVVLPGDLSWAMELEASAADFAFIDSLPGRKIILKGNHDYWWSTRRKMEKFFFDEGFGSLTVLHNSCEIVGNVCVCGTRGWFYEEDAADRRVLLREAGRLETSISLAKKTGFEPIVFLHYPPVYGDYVCGEIMDVLVKNGIRRCYYGHLHGRATRNAFEGVRDGISFRLVSADRVGFTPVLIEP